MNWANELLEIIRSGLNDLLQTDWSVVQFKQIYFVRTAALLMLAAVLLKLVWRKIFRRQEKAGLKHSGYKTVAEDRQNVVERVLGALSWVLLTGAAGLFLVAIADPYTIQSYKVQFEESREVVYIKDTSISMGWRYKATNKSRAEIVQDFVLQLIAGRKSQKDRAAYIVFASLPYLIADFTTDNDSLLFQVATGPIVTADESAPRRFPGKFILKEFDRMPFEGGTNLYLGLEAAVKVFDTKGDKKIGEEAKNNSSLKKRSVLIITDGASERDPESQFKELPKRGIVPYLIFIDPNREEEIKLHGENAQQVKLADELLKQVRRYGGEAFLATDQTSLDKIRGRLDKLYASIGGVKTGTKEQHVYRPFLISALLLCALGLTLRLVLHRYHRNV